METGSVAPNKSSLNRKTFYRHTPLRISLPGTPWVHGSDGRVGLQLSPDRRLLSKAGVRLPYSAQPHLTACSTDVASPLSQGESRKTCRVALGSGPSLSVGLSSTPRLFASNSQLAAGGEHLSMSGVSRWFANLSSSYHHSASPANGTLGIWRSNLNGSEQWLQQPRPLRLRDAAEDGYPPPPSCSSETSSESSPDEDEDVAVSVEPMTTTHILPPEQNNSIDAPTFKLRNRANGLCASLRTRVAGAKVATSRRSPAVMDPFSSPPPVDPHARTCRVNDDCRTSNRLKLGIGSRKESTAAELRLLRPTLPPPSPQATQVPPKEGGCLLRDRFNRDASFVESRPHAGNVIMGDGADTGEVVRVAANHLSAQSTLESLSVHPGMNGTTGRSNQGSSPLSMGTSGSTQGVASLSATDTSTDSAALASLFACVSPYLSPADVRMALPLTRLYDPRGPVVFAVPPLKGVRAHRGELKLWDNETERVVSQNSSNRRVHRAIWLPAAEPHCPRPAAIKFVEDANPRDGRSLKREIECHIYVYQKLPSLFQLEQELRASQVCNFSFTKIPEWSVCERLEDAWPSAELFGYHLDKKNPGKSVLLTRKLSGPDLFDVIRAEHNHNWHFHHPSNGFSSAHKCRAVYTHHNSLAATAKKDAFFRGVTAGGEGCAYYPLNYEYHKLRWCALALKRIAQYASLSIRHNDVKPDNIVLDFYTTRAGHDCLDVKLIDLGTASMHNAKDFTGGTSWYESPEQKLLEYFMKKKKKIDSAKRVDIDLPSDLWGAGISLAEVLVGKRVVDALKSPQGPGALEYLGCDAWHARGMGRSANEETAAVSPPESDCRGGGGQLENYPYWAVDPADWVGCARRALALDRENSEDRLTLEAARWIFTHLVRPHPGARMPISVAMSKLERFAEEAWKRFRHVKSSFNHADDPSAKAGSAQGPAFCISPETTSASTPATHVLASRGCVLGSAYRQLPGTNSTKISLADINQRHGDVVDSSRAILRGLLPGSNKSQVGSVFGRTRRSRVSATKESIKPTPRHSHNGLDDELKNWLGVT